MSIKVDLLFEEFKIFEDEESFGGDYYNYALFVNGEFVKTFGDWYHDKADSVAEGYIEGFVAATGCTYIVKNDELACKDPHSDKEIIKAYKARK